MKFNENVTNLNQDECDFQWFHFFQVCIASAKVYRYRVYFVRHASIFLADDVHDWDRSRDGFVCEKGSHGNHGSAAILHLNIFVSGHLFW